jgi:hypothetical protein
MAVVRSRVLRKAAPVTRRTRMSAVEVILQHRLAFVQFLENDRKLEKVKRYFPESLQFVIDNADKSFKEVSAILKVMLQRQSMIE